MPIFRKILGLDLGGHSIKAVELHQRLGGLQIAQVQGTLREEDDAAERLKQLIEVHRLSTDHVIAAVRSDRLSPRRMVFPFHERRRLAQAVPFEIEDHLPFDPDQAFFDWQTVSETRGRAEVIATVAPRLQVSELVETLQQGGCDPRVVEAEGLVLGNLVQAFDLPGSRVLCDIGHHKTTLCVIANGRAVGARSVGAAGRALTEAVAQDRGLALDAAERAKCEEGIFAAGQDRPLPRGEAVLERIAGEILRTIASLESELGVEAVSEITLLGGSAQLEHIDEWLATRTGIPTRRLALPREEYAGLVAGGSHLLFAPALALALRGLPQSTTSMNFRQDELARRVDFSRYRRQFGSTGALATLAVVLALVSFGTSSFLESRRAHSVEQRIEILYQEVFPGQAVPPNPIAALRQATRDAQAKADFLGVYGGDLSALDLLAEISRLVPEELDITFEELSIDHQTVRIRVYSKSFEAADRLGAELGRFQPFAQARIGAIETDPRTQVKKFNVTISLTPEEAA